MRKLLLATAATALVAGAASAEDVKIGLLLGFTGPIESMAPNMANGAEMAIAEVNASGKAANGWNFVPARADDSCIDAAVATAAAERLITSEGVKGVIGGSCSGVTRAVLTNIAMPNGIVMVSSSATSPALSTDPDDGLFFRTTPSDARELEVMAEILEARGIKSVAISYSNSDFGKGQAEELTKYFTAKGGQITISASHDDGKADYSAEVAALAAAGGEVLVVAGYADQGGKGIIQAALDTGAFTTFGLPNGMFSETLTTAFGSQLDGSFGQYPASDTEGYKLFLEQATANNPSYDGTTTFANTSYDAAALIILAMHAAGSTDARVYKDKIVEIANGPADGSGVVINPGDLGKALELIAAGTAINYEGATGAGMLESGDTMGGFSEVEIKGGKWEQIKFH